MSMRDDVWEQLGPMIREGRTQTEMAKSLDLTIGQLRYRLRKYRNEIAAAIPTTDPYNDESWISRYNKDVIFALAKDPHKVFVYWDVSDRRKKVISECFQCDWNVLPKILRCYDVTDIHFNGYNAHHVHQYDVHQDSGDWFLTGLQAGRHYIVDFGTSTIYNQFFVFVRSNVVALPSDRPSPTQGLDGVVRKEPVGFAECKDDNGNGVETVEAFDRSLPWAEQFTGYSLR